MKKVMPLKAALRLYFLSFSLTICAIMHCCVVRFGKKID
jgi:hypothetical protein